MIRGDWPWVTWSCAGAPSLRPYGHPSVLPGPSVPGWHVPNAPGITINSNSRGQGINRVFKCKDFPAPLLASMWSEREVFLEITNAGSCPCETSVSHLPSQNLSFLNQKIEFSKPISKLSWAPMVKVLLQCQANGQVLTWTYWGQRVRLAAAPRGWELEQLISMGEDAEVGALSRSAPSHLFHPEQVILCFWASLSSVKK